MSLSPTVMWTVIVVSGALTFGLRAVFLLRPHRDGTETGGRSAAPAWLEVIAPAALGALVLPALVRPRGTLDPLTAEAAAGVVAALIAWRTGSTAWTIIGGFACLVTLRVAL